MDSIPLSSSDKEVLNSCNSVSKGRSNFISFTSCFYYTFIIRPAYPCIKLGYLFDKFCIFLGNICVLFLKRPPKKELIEKEIAKLSEDSELLKAVGELTLDMDKIEIAESQKPDTMYVLTCKVLLKQDETDEANTITTRSLRTASSIRMRRKTRWFVRPVWLNFRLRKADGKIVCGWFGYPCGEHGDFLSSCSVCLMKESLICSEASAMR